MTALVTLAIGSFIITILYYQWKNFNFWKNRGVKTLQPNFIFGNATNLIFKKTSLHRLFGESYAKFRKAGEKYFGFYISGKPTLVVSDLGLVKQIMIKDFHYFSDRPFYTNQEVDPLSVHLVSLRGSNWKHMRDKLNPAFTPKNTKSVFETFALVSKQLKTVLDQAADKNECVNLTETVSKYNIDALGVCLFGIDCNTLQGSNSDFEYFVKKIAGGSWKRYLKLLCAYVLPVILGIFKIPFIDGDLKTYFMELTSKVINYREQNGVVKNDLIQLLIQLRNNVNIENEKSKNVIKNDAVKSLSVEEITAELIIFIAAGLESSSSMVVAFFYEVLLDKDIECKLREEVDRVLEKHGGEITYDALWEMPYLEKCLFETLRKYSTIPFMIRECLKDYIFPETNLKVERKTMVIIPSYEIHHDPEHYPDPYKFDPERFSPENRLKRPDFTFVGFGKGPRDCIGKRFGLVQVKMAVLTILKNYTFSINPKTVLPMEEHDTSLMLQFKTDLFVNFKKILK